jgi:FkbM family methyltransferase
MLKQFIRKIFSSFGYTLVKEGYSRWHPDKWHPDYLRQFGFCPRTVLDVGAAYGSPYRERHYFYESFPDAYFVLIEPLREFEPYLQGILKEYKGTYFLTALGSKEEIRIINIEPNLIERSSMFKRTPREHTGNPLSQREVPVTTLDALMEQHLFQPPFGLKIDTEGFEFQIIEGGSNFLRHTQFVIAEVPMAHRFEQSYSFTEFMDLMRSNRFYMCDILNIGRTSRNVVIFIDAVFKRED